jgi:hypothetical protein
MGDKNLNDLYCLKKLGLQLCDQKDNLIVIEVSELK